MKISYFDLINVSWMNKWLSACYVPENVSG